MGQSVSRPGKRGEDCQPTPRTSPTRGCPRAGGSRRAALGAPAAGRPSVGPAGAATSAPEAVGVSMGGGHREAGPARHQWEDRTEWEGWGLWEGAAQGNGTQEACASWCKGDWRALRGRGLREEPLAGSGVDRRAPVGVLSGGTRDIRIHLRIQLAEGRARPAEQTQLQARQQRQGQEPVGDLKRGTRWGRAVGPFPSRLDLEPGLPRPCPSGPSHSPWGSRAVGTPGNRERPAVAETPPATEAARPRASPAATSPQSLPPPGLTPPD